MVSLIPPANSLVKDYINNFIFRKADHLISLFCYYAVPGPLLKKKQHTPEVACAFLALYSLHRFRVNNKKKSKITFRSTR